MLEEESTFHMREYFRGYDDSFDQWDPDDSREKYLGQGIVFYATSKREIVSGYKQKEKIDARKRK